jgi:hypothetical protein
MLVSQVKGQIVAGWGLAAKAKPIGVEIDVFEHLGRADFARLGGQGCIYSKNCQKFIAVAHKHK